MDPVSVQVQHYQPQGEINKGSGGGGVSDDATVWTDEKHLDFLAAMEATFVRTMLTQSSSSSGGLGGGRNNMNSNVIRPENSNGVYLHQQQRGNAVRLDRYVPDMSDSTLDVRSSNSNKRPRSCVATATKSAPAASVLTGQKRISKKATRNISARQRRIRVPLAAVNPSSLSSSSPQPQQQDQVVPQLQLLLLLPEDRKQLATNM